MKNKLTEIQNEKLNNFMELVLENNKVFNLTSITDRDLFMKLHIEDSMKIFEHVGEWDYKTVVDVGTGAGIPGIVLAIAKPETKFTLIDSSNKKIKFLEEVIKTIGLENVSVIAARVEDVKLESDLVISRAVAELPVLLEICSNLAKIGGDFVFYKGPNIDTEMCKNLNKNKEIGVEFIGLIKYNLDEEYSRSLITFRKYKANQKGYPRHYSRIKKENICNYESNNNN